MGYTREEIQDSLVGQRYNEVMATYLLLGYKSSEVRASCSYALTCLPPVLWEAPGLEPLVRIEAHVINTYTLSA